MISLLKKYGELTDCKFTNEAKSEAYIKFKTISSGSPGVLLDRLRAEASKGGEQAASIFNVRLKNN